ncbi:hypothetical protein SteCoe_23718 [Stentor coeruleus]|uniref:PPM-type phosphatase domain-containing protein n=1 Tax=Stentor coeruleus TaxID=5963 RepID=A0A1R2BJA6_9CILI|nr:hypothetical protein SteCoe_23718 [Stentor coeruleus]
MGSCIPRNSKSRRVNSTLPDEILCNYPRQGSVMVRFKNYVGKVTSEQKIDFMVTEPKILSCGAMPVGSSKAFVSLCILPGMDIRNPNSKICQDSAFYISDDNSLFVGLFDGHGNEGEKVACFCQEIVRNLYLTHKEIQKKDPFEFFELITETCDKELEKKPSGINSSFSGSTGVFIYIDDISIYSGSVGDSRAILGTTLLPETLPIPNSALVDNHILQDIRERRSSNPETKIFPLQLTKDQKPYDLEERQRIEKSGGRVQRIVDEFGKRIGPYRVWDQNGNYPGLAMSRSLGDLTAKRIGVSSKPINTHHILNKQHDLFIVLGSDGLWDVMDNTDVVNFVECFRRKCHNEITQNNGTEIKLGNSCIAQILAEEARLRWYSIVEEENVDIDDISCVVIEIKDSGKVLVSKTKRVLPEISLSAEAVQEFEFKRAPSIKELIIRDPKRSSIVTEDSLWHTETTKDGLLNQ